MTAASRCCPRYAGGQAVLPQPAGGGGPHHSGRDVHLFLHRRSGQPPYGQDEVFYRDDIQMKEYAALSENTEYRYLIADGQEFGAILQAQLTLHMGKDDSFSYKGVNYDITEEGDSLYSVSSGGTLLAVAYKDIVNPSVTGEKFSFSFSFNALKAHVTGETEFTADGKTYTMGDGSVMLNGEKSRTSAATSSSPSVSAP